jgi:hypothetical protein
VTMVVRRAGSRRKEDRESQIGKATRIRTRTIDSLNIVVEMSSAGRELASSTERMADAIAEASAIPSTTLQTSAPRRTDLPVTV